MEIDNLKKPIRFFSRKAVFAALFFGLIGVCLSVGSCDKLRNLPENEIVDCERIFDTDIVFLGMNKTIAIPNGNGAMTVYLAEVSDERCPKSVCHLCFGSKATILLSVTNSEGTNVEIDLSILGCIAYDDYDDYISDSGVDTLGYRFQLIRLLPYPDIEPIDKEDYIAKIKITKI